MNGRTRLVRPVNHALSLTLFLLATTGCKGETSKGVLHPREEFITPGPNVEAPLVLPEPGSPLLTSNVSDLWYPNERLIGELERPAEKVFGVLKGAKADRAGNLLVLDQRTSEVRVFDTTGRLTAQLGRAGRGPGEFVDPQTMYLSNTGRVLWIGDLTRQLHRFTFGDSGWAYSTRFAIPVSASDMCELEGRVFIHGVGVTEKQTIYEIGDTGRVLNSFGMVYDSPNDMIWTTLSRGRLECVEGAGLIVFAPSSGIPQVRAYSPDGTMKWILTIKNFHSPHVYERPRGLAVAPRSDGWHSIRGLAAGPNNQVLVQIAFITAESNKEGLPFKELRSYIVDAGTGTVRHAGDSLPLIDDWKAHRTVATIEDPYPRVIVREGP